MTPTQRTLAITAAASIQTGGPAILTQDDLDALAAFVAHCCASHARPNAGAKKASALTRQEQVRDAVRRHRETKKIAESENKA